MANQLTTKKQWEETINEKTKEKSDLNFIDTIKKYIPKAKKGQKMIEIGSRSGRYLIKLNQELGYIITGIDITETKATIKNIQKHGIKEYKILKKDINKYKPKNKYDLTCAFGLIEHFKKPIIIIKKIIKITRKGGYIVITIPNHKGIRGILKKIDNPEIKKTHNRLIMHPDTLRLIMEHYNIQTIHSTYYGNFTLSSQKTIINSISRTISIINRRLMEMGIHIKTQNFSPHIIYIGRKK